MQKSAAVEQAVNGNRVNGEIMHMQSEVAAMRQLAKNDRLMMAREIAMLTEVSRTMFAPPEQVMETLERKMGTTQGWASYTEFYEVEWEDE